MSRAVRTFTSAFMLCVLAAAPSGAAPGEPGPSSGDPPRARARYTPALQYRFHVVEARSAAALRAAQRAERRRERVERRERLRERKVERRRRAKRRAARLRRRHYPARVSRLGFVWPRRDVVTSRYGRRRSGFHHGLDLDCRKGDRIRSAKKGRVILAGRLPVYGRTVVVRHPRGWSTLYAHLKGIGVRHGERVRRGERLGACGSSGRSTGSHLHFEVRRYGRYYAPRPLMPRRR